jgi:hypothetical protein
MVRSYGRDRLDRAISRSCLAVKNQLSRPAARGGSAATSMAAAPPFLNGSGNTEGEPVSSWGASWPKPG